MMSHHLNTMFGHFKMASLKKSSKNTPEIVETSSDPETTGDEITVIENEKIRKNSVNYISNNNHGHDLNNITANNHSSNNHQTQNGGSVMSNGSASGTPSPKKRNSMTSQSVVQNNDVKNTINCGQSGQMNLSPRIGQRKLSADMRLRGLNPEDGDSVSYHIKPVKLKTVTTKAEYYDTLHCKAAKQVSNACIFIYRKINKH